MGQDREKRQSESDVFLDIYEKEITEDIKFERRLYWVQMGILFVLIALCIAREFLWPSDILWIEGIRLPIEILASMVHQDGFYLEI